jgi:hypothetical protein
MPLADVYSLDQNGLTKDKLKNMSDARIVNRLATFVRIEL